MMNGTLERLSIGTEYALATLSTMFPTSIVNNIGFLYTYVSSRLSLNTLPTSIPSNLRSCESWTIQNPVALHAKYLEQAENAANPDELEDMQRALHTCYFETLEMITSMLKWLDERSLQPSGDITKLCDLRKSIENAIRDVTYRTEQVEAKSIEMNSFSTSRYNYCNVSSSSLHFVLNMR
jgi:hypothetical protein